MCTHVRARKNEVWGKPAGITGYYGASQLLPNTQASELSRCGAVTTGAPSDYTNNHDSLCKQLQVGGEEGDNKALARQGGRQTYNVL